MSHSNIDCYNIISTKDYKSSEVGTITHGNNESNRFLSTPHQLVFSKDKTIVTNTGRNCLSLVGNNLSHKNIWFEEAKWDRLGDDKCGSHFNSVFKTDDNLYVVGHNWDNPSKVVILNKYYNVVGIHSQPNIRWAHNVWVDGDDIIVCNSKEGQLADIKSGRIIWDGKPIIRGLAVTDDFIVVGKSATDGSRKARKYSNSGLYIIDRKTLKTVEYIELNGLGCVNEVRIIDEVDYAHFGNGWIPFPG